MDTPVTPPTPDPTPAADAVSRRHARRSGNGKVEVGARGLHIERRFTKPGVHPYDEVQWERRTASISNEKGEVVFEQKDCEIPAFWSQMATNVVVSKYFRGPLGTPRRETSVRQVISRVVDTITGWGREGGYFATDADAEAFSDELTHLILHQRMSFNSPVWFNLGVQGARQQASACQPYEARVVTPEGLVPIGELVERDACGAEVLDRDGVTWIVATKANGRKEVFRLEVASGITLDATADHVILVAGDAHGNRMTWKRLDEVQIGDRVVVDGSRSVFRPLHVEIAELAGLGEPRPRTGRSGRHRQQGDVDAWAETVASAADEVAVAEATLAGWLQGDGYVGYPPGPTCNSLVIEAQPADAEELAEVERLLDLVFPAVHRKATRSHPGQARGCYRVRLAGDVLVPFVQKWELLTRGPKMRVPSRLWGASAAEIAGYLRGLFQADGYVSLRPQSLTQRWPASSIGLGLVAGQLAADVQQLLLSFGIHSVRGSHEPGRGRRTFHVLRIGKQADRLLFAELVGFPCARKAALLRESLAIGEDNAPRHAVRYPSVTSMTSLGVMDVYDIQTASGTYLSNHVVVHNCFIQSVDDSMESILTLAKNEGMLFKGGSGTGTNLSAIRSSFEQLAGGGTASGPVSFMKGFDAFAGVIKSGGTTRRAAKMVILNADHPDVEEFITCKVSEERKAWALIDAGYDPSFTGEAYASVFFQNSNNSVRVTDEFMRAVEEDRDWQLRAVTDPSRIIKTVKARALLRLMAESAWQCGDPGIQYDTTINDWHTSSNSGRINASNPCCLVGSTLVETSLGSISFEELHRAGERGEVLPLARTWNLTKGRNELRPIRRVWVAGETTQLVEVTLADGALRVRATPEHRFLTADGSWVQAIDLTPGQTMLLEDEAVKEAALLRLTMDGKLSTAVPASRASLGVTDGRPTVPVTSVRLISLESPVQVYDMEVAGTHNFVVSGPVPGASVVAHNSEYMYLDDSACNLASINVLRFLKEDGSFAVEDYRHAVRMTITAQEIVVSFAAYPTEQIGKNSEDFRPLGLGYANLGALLMARGLPYDSPKGRDLASCLTAILTGEGYAQSARIAREVGPFNGFAVNRQPMLRVMAKHREAAYAIPATTVDADLLAAARASWDEAHELGARHGYRNGQISVIAPTGTISFMLDCDTTGVEPDIALVKYKKLVGGGMLKMVNNTVPAALKRLGYGEGEIADIVAYIDANDTIEGSPKLRDDDLPVFDCAFTPHNGKRSIAWQGHVRMMAAVQPFVSGAISKTVNMPSDSTVEDVEKAYIDGWKMGLKALAIYRDGSKRSQPLATSMDKTTGEKVRIVERPLRRKLPAERQALTHRFEVGGHEGYITVGLYEDGSPGEIFVKMAKEGSTVSGLTDSFAIAVSFALQYGVPLDFLVNKFAHMRFEPQGFTRNPEIPIAKSIVDYIFRWLGSRFLSSEKQVEIGIIRRDEEDAGEEPLAAVEGPANAAQVVMPLGFAEISPTATFQNQADAPSCSECGSLMVRSGSCYKCHNCGATSGCS